MLSYSCIIVEDEPLAIETLQDFIGMVPFLRLDYICTDAIQALEVVRQNKIDLIFLDIHLPELKGMDFMRLIDQCPPVIITSAYHEYALTGYEYNVVDYLLKPFDFARFIKAVNKLSLQQGNVELASPGATEKPFLLVSVNKRKTKIFTEDIFYIESLREYVKIFTSAGTIVTKLSIGQLDQWLGNRGFVRIHRSFIVSREKVKSFTASYVEINNRQIPVGRNYRQNMSIAFKDGQVHK